MTGTVKALEWEAYPGANEVMTEGYGQRRQYLERALFGFGAYCLMVKDGRYSVKSDYMDGPEYDTGEAAKAAAQADYERRVLSALTASASEPTAPLIEQVDALLALASRDALAPKVPHLALELLRRCRDAVASPVPASEPEPSVADKILREIEERFPNWKGFRDLVDCIDVTLHNLREARPLPAKPEGE